MHQLSKAHIHTLFTRSSRQNRQRAIMFVAPTGTVPDRLKFGIEREMPWIVMIEVETVAEACRVFPDTVSLILMHCDLLCAAEAAAPALNRSHPLALTALIDPTARLSGADQLLLCASPLVRGVLPLNVRLDISMAIIMLMLRGGEYFPKMSMPAKVYHDDLPAQTQEAEPVRTMPEFLDLLTKREMQVLELVARGLQNKAIAAHLHLSEFTVKIHLHNIITKLGAHNRTEAAAVFHDYMADTPGPVLRH